MPQNVKELFARLSRMPFPALGKRVGDFPLLDSLIAGCAERAARGEFVSPSEIPVPDDETSRRVMELRGKTDLSEDESAFLHYFDLLEEIRASLFSLGLH